MSVPDRVVTAVVVMEVAAFVMTFVGAFWWGWGQGWMFIPLAAVAITYVIVVEPR